jgi:hypothetical protein
MTQKVDMVWLHSFGDAIAAGEACQYLEDAAIPFRLDDDEIGRLEILVEPRAIYAARDVLREKMNLFPEKVDATECGLEETGSEEAQVQAVVVEDEAMADEIREFLKMAGISSTVRSFTDEDDATLYSVDVRQGVAERALRVLDSWGT